MNLWERKEQVEGGCGWIVAVPTHLFFPPEAEWYPDSPSDVHTEVPCNEPVKPGGRYGLCPRHEAAMAIPDDEYEAISEAHDGRAFS